MISIKKFPILILSSPRTGSTVLGDYIKQTSTIDIPYFLEPDYDGKFHMDRFRKYFQSSKSFILKCHLYNLNLYGNEIEEYLRYSPEVYRIRIRRKDIVDQIASFYIALQRNKKWHYRNKEDTMINDRILIDTKIISYSINFIKDSNRKLNETDIQFDQDIWYEDLGVLHNLNFYKAPAPTNINEIRSIITQYLD